MKTLAEIRRTEEYENLRLTLNEPNIFNILKIEEYEIRHSNFLAWLLDPKESHGLNEYFVKWFLFELANIYEECENVRENFLNTDVLDNLDWRYFSVHREVKIKCVNDDKERNRFIDVFIVYNPEHNSKSSFTITIENKIRAKDSKNQLSNYYDAVNDKVLDIHELPEKCKKNFFVYLTPEGDLPRDEKMVSKYVPMGYDVIYKKLKWVLDVKKDWISEKSARYINDYLGNLEINVLNCNESVMLLSQKLMAKLSKSDDQDDDVIKYAKSHCDLNKDVKDLMEKCGFEILKKETTRDRIRFLPKQLPEKLEKFRIENEKNNGVDNRHLPNYSLIVFELKIERNEDDLNIVRFGVTIAPSKYHSKLRSCIDENLIKHGFESKINTMHKGANRWHSVFKPCNTRANVEVLEEHVRKLLVEKKNELSIIAEAVEKWVAGEDLVNA